MFPTEQAPSGPVAKPTEVPIGVLLLAGVQPESCLRGRWALGSSGRLSLGLWEHGGLSLQGADPEGLLGTMPQARLPGPLPSSSPWEEGWDPASAPF